MRFPKTQVIALVNQKGGCGKTTSSVAIAAGFAISAIPSAWLILIHNVTPPRASVSGPKALWRRGSLPLLTPI